MKTLIYGAGPIGRWLALRLHQAGADVTLLARGQTYHSVQSRGVEIIESVVQGVNPRARVERTESGRRATYDVTVDAAAEPAKDDPMTAVARVSTGATIELVRRRPLRRASS